MKVGDLVKNAYGNIGIITKRSERSNRHVWVQWCVGNHHTVHVRNLEVVCK